MKQFWITVFGSIFGVIIGSVLTAFLLIFAVIGMIASAGNNAEQVTGLPSGNMVLELDLRLPRPDSPSRAPFDFGEIGSLVDVVRTLDSAANDPRVAGLFIRANEFGMSAAQAEELHRAIAAFRATGRSVTVHAQGFEGTSITNYFAVSDADEIWLQDTATFSSSGLYGELAFYGGTLNRLGVEADFIQFLEYKNAPNIYTQTGFTEEHRESTFSYFNSIYDSSIRLAADSRGFEEDAFRSLIEAAPYSAEDALSLGLVSRLGHVAAAREAAIALAGGNARFANFEDYRLASSLNSYGRRIALIEGQGAIVTGNPSISPFGGDAMIGGDAMASAIDEAAETPGIEAIIIRLDTPGGSAIASDQVWDAVRRAQDQGLPVVISIGGSATSGGYYIAAPADYIIANATSLTGSIGVYGGALNLRGAFELIGANFETVTVGGAYASAYSSVESWTQEQRAAREAMLADVYEDFTSRVAEGRNIPIETVQEIARGRVWTGEQAIELGLVDEIGGFMEAVDAARRLAGLADGATISLQRFPREVSPWEAFQNLFGVSAESAQTLAQLNGLMDLPEVQAALEARRQADAPDTLRGRFVQPH